MITKNSKVKCDVCGKFVKTEDHKTVFTPDSYYTDEKIQDFDKECYEGVRNDHSKKIHDC